MQEPLNQPGTVSNFKLKVSYWYVTHKLELEKSLVIFLIVLSVILYGYSLFEMLMILVVQNRGYQQDLYSLTSNSIDYNYFHQAARAQDLEITSFDVTSEQNGRADYIAKLINPNANFVARKVVLQLISGDRVAAEKTVFIYPKEEKYIAFFGQETKDIVSPAVKIASVNWWRVHQFEQFSQPRLQFDITDLEFKPAEELKIKGELPVSTLNFKITNNTAYSYWRVGVTMVLISVDQAVGANYLTLEQFKSGETRNVEMRWYESLPSVTQALVSSEVDLLDPGSYMPVQ